MRHRKTTPTLQRSPSHRKAMLRSMVTDLLRHERIRTTQAKAKAVRRVAERMITLGKKETVHARRNAARTIRDKAVIKKLFDDLAPRYAQRPGGYTRIIKLPSRSGDGADMAIIELVEAEMEAKPRRKKPSGGPRTAAQDTAAAAAAAETEVEEAPAEEPEAEEPEEAQAEEAQPADEDPIEESQKPEVDAAPEEEVVPDREELQETDGEVVEDPEVDKEEN